MVAMYGGVKEYIDFLFDIRKERFEGKSRDDKELRCSVCWNILQDYTSGYLSEESLIACSEYLGISKNDLDLNVIREIKDRREKERENIRKYHMISREEHLKILALQSQYYKWAKCETEEEE